MEDNRLGAWDSPCWTSRANADWSVIALDVEAVVEGIGYKFLSVIEQVLFSQAQPGELPAFLWIEKIAVTHADV